VLICWLNVVAAKLGLLAVTTFSELHDGLLLSQLAHKLTGTDDVEALAALKPSESCWVQVHLTLMVEYNGSIFSQPDIHKAASGDSLEIAKVNLLPLGGESLALPSKNFMEIAMTLDCDCQWEIHDMSSKLASAAAFLTNSHRLAVLASSAAFSFSR